MSRIRGKNTSPEKLVRSYLSSQHLRYRLHYSKLPGKPDIVFVKKRIAVFINGCFWHQHKNCKYATIPKTNAEFWQSKLEATTKRDIKNRSSLEDQGWKVLTIWECDIEKNIESASAILIGKINS